MISRAYDNALNHIPGRGCHRFTVWIKLFSCMIASLSCVLVSFPQVAQAADASMDCQQENLTTPLRPEAQFGDIFSEFASRPAQYMTAQCGSTLTYASFGGNLCSRLDQFELALCNGSTLQVGFENDITRKRTDLNAPNPNHLPVIEGGVHGARCASAKSDAECAAVVLSGCDCGRFQGEGATSTGFPRLPRNVAEVRNYCSSTSGGSSHGFSCGRTTHDGTVGADILSVRANGNSEASRGSGAWYHGAWSGFAGRAGGKCYQVCAWRSAAESYIQADPIKKAEVVFRPMSEMNIRMESKADPSGFAKAWKAVAMVLKGGTSPDLRANPSLDPVKANGRIPTWKELSKIPHMNRIKLAFSPMIGPESALIGQSAAGKSPERAATIARANASFKIQQGRLLASLKEIAQHDPDHRLIDIMAFNPYSRPLDRGEAPPSLQAIMEPWIDGVVHNPSNPYRTKKIALMEVGVSRFDAESEVINNGRVKVLTRAFRSALPRRPGVRSVQEFKHGDVVMTRGKNPKPLSSTVGYYEKYFKKANSLPGPPCETQAIGKQCEDPKSRDAILALSQSAHASVAGSFEVARSEIGMQASCLMRLSMFTTPACSLWKSLETTKPELIESTAALSGLKSCVIDGKPCFDASELALVDQIKAQGGLGGIREGVTKYLKSVREARTAKDLKDLNLWLPQMSGDPRLANKNPEAKAFVAAYDRLQKLTSGQSALMNRIARKTQALRDRCALLKSKDSSCKSVEGLEHWRKLVGGAVNSTREMLLFQSRFAPGDQARFEKQLTGVVRDLGADTSRHASAYDQAREKWLRDAGKWWSDRLAKNEGVLPLMYFNGPNSEWGIEAGTQSHGVFNGRLMTLDSKSSRGNASCSVDGRKPDDAAGIR